MRPVGNNNKNCKPRAAATSNCEGRAKVCSNHRALHAASGREKMKNIASECYDLEVADRGRVFGSVMEVPGALGKDMAAILRKAAAYADHLDMRPPSEWAMGIWIYALGSY